MPKTVTQTIALNRSNSRQRLNRLLIILFFLLLTIWAVSPLWQRLEQQQELNRLNQQMTNAKSQEKQLRKEILDLQNNNNFIELMVRKKLGMIKPGEEAYIVVETKPKRGKE